jgi:glycosyl-4,4'-diaponeurosporenoate acyltransferase
VALPSISFYHALWVDIAIWALWSPAVGWWAARLPDSALATDGWLTRLRPWEREGRLYARIGIRRWKGMLPDFSPLFGGRHKRLPPQRDPSGWRLLAGETRRAERVHWIILAALPAEALLRSGVVLVPMTVYALVANGPCIAAQRYNRGRLMALCARRGARSTGSAGSVTAPGGSPGRNGVPPPREGTLPASVAPRR